MRIFDRKENLEVIIAGKKVMIKMLAVTPYANVRLVRNFNEIVKKYRIPYESLVSGRYQSPEYAMATNFIENQMLERNLEIHIYSFEGIKTGSRFKVAKNVIYLILRVAITIIFLLGLVALYNKFF